MRQPRPVAAPASPSLYQRGLQARAAAMHVPALPSLTRIARQAPAVGTAPPVQRLGSTHHVQAASEATANGSWWTPTRVTVAVIAAAAGIGLAIYRHHKHAIRSENVLHGYESEFAIATSLERRGAEVAVSPGSRGPVDVDAAWPTRRWAIQVKASQLGEPRWPGPDERARLLRASRARGAEPVIALRRGTRTSYYDALTHERLQPLGT